MCTELSRFAWVHRAFSSPREAPCRARKRHATLASQAFTGISTHYAASDGFPRKAGRLAGPILRTGPPARSRPRLALSAPCKAQPVSWRRSGLKAAQTPALSLGCLAVLFRFLRAGSLRVGAHVRRSGDPCRWRWRCVEKFGKAGPPRSKMHDTPRPPGQFLGERHRQSGRQT
jgi:hypothetical protein